MFEEELRVWAFTGKDRRRVGTQDVPGIQEAECRKALKPSRGKGLQRPKLRLKRSFGRQASHHCSEISGFALLTV